MAVLDIKQIENVGLVKDLDNDSIDIIFKNLQESQYSFPIKSFIREVASNCLDSVKEKWVADQIMNKGILVTDFFVERNQAEVKDSKFEPSYYDWKFMNVEDDKIYISYEERENELKDLVALKDNGVGLSSYRLRKYTTLGWSSKRNNKQTIGKFGIGAKAGLATGASFFTTTTRYNGYTTTLMIYHNHFHCITEPEEGHIKEEWKGLTTEGKELSIPITWNPTTELNGVEVTLEVPKYTKDKYIQAVKDQLLYYSDQIQFTLINRELYGDTLGYHIELELTKLFESDNCIIPKSCSYTEPHIVIGGINYGIIAFDELGIEKRRGRIALKIDASEVDVNQSRETVIWSEKTRTTVLKKVEDVTRDAENYLKDKIQTTDNFFEWIDIVGKMGSLSNNDDVIYQLSKFVPKANLQFEWSLEDTYKKIDVDKWPRPKVGIIKRDTSSFDWLFDSFNVMEIQLGQKYHPPSNRNIPWVRQDKIDSWRLFNKSVFILYAKEVSISLNVVRYLFDKHKITSLIYVREKSEQLRTERSLDINYVTWQLIKDVGIDLDTLEVPEEFIKTLKEEEKIIEEKVKEVEIAEKVRKSKQGILTYRKSHTSYWLPFVDGIDTDKYSLNITSTKWGWINKLEGYRDINFSVLPNSFEQIIYTTDEGDSKWILQIVQKLVTITIDKTRLDKVLFCIVSKKNAKLLEDYDIAISLSDFIMSLNGTEMKLHQLFTDFNTTRVLSDLLGKYPYLRYLTYIRSIDPEFEKIRDKWETYTNIPVNLTNDSILLDYVTYDNDHDTEIRNKELFKVIMEYLKHTEEVHRLNYEGSYEQSLAKSKEYFGSDKPLTVSAIDIELIDAIEKLAERLKPILPILDNLDYQKIQKEGSIGEEIGDLLASLL